jgi:hypothetical protein
MGTLQVGHRRTVTCSCFAPQQDINIKQGQINAHSVPIIFALEAKHKPNNY